MSVQDFLLLKDALQEATKNGTLDALAAELHPDIINAFCDAITAITIQNQHSQKG